MSGPYFALWFRTNELRSHSLFGYSNASCRKVRLCYNFLLSGANFFVQASDEGGYRGPRDK